MKIKEKVLAASQNAKYAATGALTTAMIAVPTICAHAEEASSGSNLLTGDVWTAITGGFGDLATTCTQVLAISCVTGIGIVGMTAAAKYAMKKIKGMLSQAA